MSSESEDKIVNEAVLHLASVFGDENIGEPTGEQTDALWLACEQICNNLSIPINKPIRIPEQSNYYNLLMEIAHSSEFRVRRVTLKGLWWQFDNGPLLVFDATTQSPFAAIIDKKGKYQLIDPISGEQRIIDAALAQQLALGGYIFYRSFPNAKLKILTLIRFAFQGRLQDVWRALALQVGMGLLALFIPIATGVILDIAVPSANFSILGQWVLGLLVCSVTIVMFNAIQILSMLRLRFKINAYSQAAIWDRLLRLPVGFFREFTPGDLVVRASGIDTIQQNLTDAAMQTLLSGIFSFLTLGLMFYYSPPLAIASMVLLLFFVIAVIVEAQVELRYQRPVAKLIGQLAALMLQFLTNISKIRVCHIEARAFGIWAKQFSRKNRFFLRASLWAIRFSIVRVLLSVIGLIGLYGLVGSKISHLTFGEFIAFNAAFGQFFAAVLGMAGIVATLIRLIPFYERIQPILNAQPEREIEGIDPGILSGQIQLEHVNFRYHVDNLWVLEDINISIPAGKMIALVGPTGCGKSTIFRLLLGFETPVSGKVIYDFQDLNRLNLRVVREQLGVVLQNGAVLHGTIFENIVGSYPLTQEQAWEAAAMAGLAKDIEEMPMGMQTLVSEGGTTLSGGQRQRLMIARALVRKPRILFFDEATSSLDNPTQQSIMQHLEQLNITRIIAAHRLSTVINADCIYVIQDGKVLQSGSYESLIAEKGLFLELVTRQLI